jgi:glycosyltransferase involved in cell wall biosynthesis
LNVSRWSFIAAPVFAMELAWFLRRHRPDSVMSFLVRSNLTMILSRWLGNHGRIVISERCATDALYTGRSFTDRIMRWLISSLYPSADRIVAISNGVKAALMRLGVPGSGIRVIYNPQNLSQIDANIGTAPVESPVSSRPFTIVTAGRLTEQKDYPTLFEAFKQVCTDGLDARLVIFGEGPDEAKLKALAERLQIADRVDWRGWVASPHAQMAAGDVFVMTSRWEGFGNVIVEAMACGLPVVCTDCESGPREILADGECGILVPVRDAGAVAAAIRQLAADPQMRARIRERGLLRSRDFDVHRIAQQYVDVLTE